MTALIWKGTSQERKNGIIYHQFANEVIDIYNESFFSLPLENSKLGIDYTKFNIDYDNNFTDVACKNDDCRFTYKKNGSDSNFLGFFNKNSVTFSSEKIDDIEGFGTMVVFADFNQIAWYDIKTNSVKYKTIQ